MNIKSKRKTILPLFEKFIRDSRNGHRVKINGHRISANTIENYSAAYRYLKKLDESYPEPIRILSKLNLTHREIVGEKKYWLRVYKRLKDLMYANGCSDNYVGMIVKVLRTFLRYLEINLNLCSGAFYRLFYPPKSENPVFVLDREKLRFLIGNAEFHQSLSDKMKLYKDIFVFGCTVGLRFSDLKALNSKNLEIIGNTYYIVNVSGKTKTSTRVKLPWYCIEILMKYKNRYRLLPIPTLNEFNKNLKLLGEAAGWTFNLDKQISVQGKSKSYKNVAGRSFRFCDHLSSHVMRKTAISTMLILGMPEPLVRKVSGHAANSREFYRYVKYSESFVDKETDKVFEKLLNCI